MPASGCMIRIEKSDWAQPRSCVRRRGVGRLGLVIDLLDARIGDPANHCDPPGAHQLDDAQRSHEVDERLDLLLLAGNLDDDFLGGDVDDPPAENFGQFADFAAQPARWEILP